MDQGFVYFNNDWVVDFQKSDKEVIKNDLIIRVSRIVEYQEAVKNLNDNIKVFKKSDDRCHCLEISLLISLKNKTIFVN